MARDWLCKDVAMHPILLAAHQSRGLTSSAKLVLSALYARTNGTLAAAIRVEELLAELGLAESSLRRRRSELAAGGWLSSRLDGETLLFEILEPAEPAEPAGPGEPGERAPSARGEGDERAVGARCEAERAVGARCEEGERAASARSGEPNAQLVRANAHLVREAAPPIPPRRVGGVKLINQEVLNPPSPEGGVGGTGPAAQGWDPAAHLPGGEVADGPPSGPGERLATAELLAAAGLSRTGAARLAQGHGFWYCLALAQQFRAEAARARERGKDLGAGILSHRIVHAWPAPRLDPDDEFYLAQVFAGDANRALVARYREA